MLFKTKIFFPKPVSDYIYRKDLIETLTEHDDKKLVLVSAPPGYGKTVLVSDWLRKDQDDCIWISFDSNEDELFHFYRYVAFAFAEKFPELGKSLNDFFDSYDAIKKSLIGKELVKLWSQEERKFRVVFDNFQFINDREVFEDLNFLLEAMPGNFQLIIITRKDPLIYLAKLRVQGELLEIRQKDLRFSDEEAEIFLNQKLDLGLDRDEIIELNYKTEGWAASLRLAAVSMKEIEDRKGFVARFKGTHRFVFDYLVDEVLNYISDDLKLFLFQTSLFERFSAEFCHDVLNGESIARYQEMIDELEQNNLFVVPLDNERKWYRFHQLFNEFLNQRFQKENKELRDKLLKKAALWHLGQDEFPAAVDCYIKSEKYHETIQLIESKYTLTELFLKYYEIKPWIEKIPSKYFYDYPSMLFPFILLLLMRLDFKRISEIVEYFEQHDALIQDPMYKEIIEILKVICYFVFSPSDSLINIGKKRISVLTGLLDSEHLVVRLFVCKILLSYYQIMGNMELATLYAMKQIEFFREASLDTEVINGIADLAQIYWHQGYLKKSYELFTTFLNETKYDYLKEANNFQKSVSDFYIHYGMVLYEWNEIEEAEKILDRLMELPGLELFPISYVELMFLKAYVCWAKKEFEKSLRFLRRGLNKLNDFPNLPRKVINHGLVHLIDLKVKIYKETNDDILKEEIETWLRMKKYDEADELHYFQQIELLVYCRLRIIRKEYSCVVALLRKLVDYAFQGKRYYEFIVSGIQLYFVESRLNKNYQDLDLLSNIMNFAENDNHVRAFLDEGIVGKTTLQEASMHGLCKSYAEKVMALYDTEEETGKIERNILGSKEDFNAREIAIIRRLRQGLRNQEIADELYISVNTVKWYTKKIYEKLQVNNRQQAVMAAEELELI